MTIEDLALTFVPHLGVRGTVHLLDVYGLAERIFAASESDLAERAQLRTDIARSIVRRAGFAEAEREMKHCSRHGIEIVASTDVAYPEFVRTAADYPHILYMKGDASALRSPHVLSIVGTRKMTSYGERVCNEIVEGIAAEFPDAVIVSGLAFGSDAAAHRAALAFGLRTVGVVANALPDIVPAQNGALARDMIARGGAVVTEVTSQTKQNGNLYIPRNRIIAALGEGLLVIESPANGGSMSTVAAADAYSREIMAVPGRATDTMSVGTNSLIRNRVAQMVVSAADVISCLGWTASAVPERVHAEMREPTACERYLLDCFPESGDAVAFDELVVRSGLAVGEAAARLLDLELSGDVRCLPGRIYEKLR